MQRLSLVAASEGYALVAVCRPLIAVASLIAEPWLLVGRLQKLWFAASRARAR